MAPRVGALTKMMEPMWEWAATKYQAKVGAELRKYGLRYDDLLDPMMSMDIEKAITRIPQKDIDDRHARLKRAMDLSMKHVHLDKNTQKLQTPFLPYITPKLLEVEAENDERKAIGAAIPYERAIP
mmetsp:Transcript_33061/g.55346  ORF Transcript_33061/g.55346 Transcript_33061/m.55346 type:complete len:126 (+) Transcript_33061:96-473(+)|eukprot:CAMPEP_0198207476 /NCGR_PEP_ID=MMETSP1445-20131203/10921_1 /TAXON_ID=36898 /ORGANISM="Pyramimonas sp., Strain CCMP2087" /LENGTH=125 /DNA_ID=CAMNT_0043880519 /DNA_START=115 /DNA_END=492 /DNA_ORIENTATION=+